MSNNKNLIAAGAALISVVVGLAMGYRMLGPLGDQRAISADERRVEDLQSLSQRLYSASRKELPVSLSQINEAGNLRLHDPLTKTRYEYVRDSATAYRLCATFSFASSEKGSHRGHILEFWDHPKGHYCYQLDSGKYSY